MCTLITLRRPGHAWPLLVAANRDELASRASRPPDRHWPDRPEVVAGMDELAGGTWLGRNDWGVVAAVLNRQGTLGPSTGKRSRGELVLEALEHADARDAAKALSSLDPEAWRPFNLMVGDDREAFWLRHAGDGRIDAMPIPSGVSMLTSRDLDDPADPRIRRYRPLFRAAPAPDPEMGDWSDWQLLMGARASESGDPRDALCIVTGGDYGTVSASLLGVPADRTRPIIHLHAEGRPGEAPFVPITA